MPLMENKYHLKEQQKNAINEDHLLRNKNGYSILDAWGSIDNLAFSEDCLLFSLTLFHATIWGLTTLLCILRGTVTFKNLLDGS